MLDVERHVMCTCTYIQPLLESLNTEYKLHVYMSVREGWFHKDRGEGQQNFKKF